MEKRKIDPESIPEGHKVLQFVDGDVIVTPEHQEAIRRRTMELMEQFRDGVFEGKYNPMVLLDIVDTMQWCYGRAACELFNRESVWTSHRHQCIDPKCGTIWEHDPMDTYFNAEGEEYSHSHDCPRCGKQQTKIYGYPERSDS